jgi:hypothetical protein
VKVVAQPNAPLPYGHPNIGTFLASQLVRRLRSFRVVGLDELLIDLATASWIPASEPSSLTGRPTEGQVAGERGWSEEFPRLHLCTDPPHPLPDGTGRSAPRERLPRVALLRRSQSAQALPSCLNIVDGNPELDAWNAHGLLPGVCLPNYEILVGDPVAAAAVRAQPWGGQGRAHPTDVGDGQIGTLESGLVRRWDRPVLAEDSEAYSRKPPTPLHPARGRCAPCARYAPGSLHQGRPSRFAAHGFSPLSGSVCGRYGGRQLLSASWCLTHW